MKRVDNLHMCMMVAMTVNGEYKHAESAKDIRTSRTGMVRGGSQKWTICGEMIRVSGSSKVEKRCIWSGGATHSEIRGGTKQWMCRDGRVLRITRVAGRCVGKWMLGGRCQR